MVFFVLSGGRHQRELSLYLPDLVPAFTIGFGLVKKGLFSLGRPVKEGPMPLAS